MTSPEIKYVINSDREETSKDVGSIDEDCYQPKHFVWMPPVLIPKPVKSSLVNAEGGSLRLKLVDELIGVDPLAETNIVYDCDICSEFTATSKELELKIHQIYRHINPFYISNADRDIALVTNYIVRQNINSTSKNFWIPDRSFSGLYRCHRCFLLCDKKQELQQHLDTHLDDVTSSAAVVSSTTSSSITLPIVNKFKKNFSIKLKDYKNRSSNKLSSALLRIKQKEFPKFKLCQGHKKYKIPSLLPNSTFGRFVLENKRLKREVRRKQVVLELADEIGYNCAARQKKNNRIDLSNANSSFITLAKRDSLDSLDDIGVLPANQEIITILPEKVEVEPDIPEEIDPLILDRDFYAGESELYSIKPDTTTFDPLVVKEDILFESPKGDDDVKIVKPVGSKRKRVAHKVFKRSSKHRRKISNMESKEKHLNESINHNLPVKSYDDNVYISRKSLINQISPSIAFDDKIKPNDILLQSESEFIQSNGRPVRKCKDKANALMTLSLAPSDNDDDYDDDKELDERLRKSFLKRVTEFTTRTVGDTVKKSAASKHPQNTQLNMNLTLPLKVNKKWKASDDDKCGIGVVRMHRKRKAKSFHWSRKKSKPNKYGLSSHVQSEMFNFASSVLPITPVPQYILQLPNIEEIIPDLRSTNNPPTDSQSATGKLKRQNMLVVLQHVLQPIRHFVCVSCLTVKFAHFSQCLLHDCHKAKEKANYKLAQSRVWKDISQHNELQCDVNYSEYISMANERVPESTFNNMHGRIGDIQSMDANYVKNVGGLDLLTIIERVRLNISGDWSTKEVWINGGWELSADHLTWFKYENRWSPNRRFLHLLSQFSWFQQKAFMRVFDTMSLNSTASSKAYRNSGSNFPSWLCLERLPRYRRGSKYGVRVSNVSLTAYMNGEWEYPRRYMCVACSQTFPQLLEVMEHKWDVHPYCLVSHIALDPQMEMPPTCFLYPQIGRSMSRLPATLAVSGGGSQRMKCSKCGLLLRWAERHLHMVDCGANQLSYIIAASNRKSRRKGGSWTMGNTSLGGNLKSTVIQLRIHRIKELSSSSQTKNSTKLSSSNIESSSRKKAVRMFSSSRRSLRHSVSTVVTQLAESFSPPNFNKSNRKVSLSVINDSSVDEIMEITRHMLAAGSDSEEHFDDVISNTKNEEDALSPCTSGVNADLKHPELNSCSQIKRKKNGITDRGISNKEVTCCLKSHDPPSEITRNNKDPLINDRSLWNSRKRYSMDSNLSSTYPNDENLKVMPVSYEDQSALQQKIEGTCIIYRVTDAPTDKLEEADSVIIPNDNNDEQTVRTHYESAEQLPELPEWKAENGTTFTDADTLVVLVDKAVKSDCINSVFIHNDDNEQTATKHHESIERLSDVPEGKVENGITFIGADALVVSVDKSMESDSINSVVIPNDDNKQTSAKHYELVEQLPDVPEGKAENGNTSTEPDALIFLVDKSVESDSINSVVIPNNDNEQTAAKNHKLVEQLPDVSEGKAENGTASTNANTLVLVDKAVESDCINSVVIHNDETAAKHHELIEQPFDVLEEKVKNDNTFTADDTLVVLVDKLIEADPLVKPIDDEQTVTRNYKPIEKLLDVPEGKFENGITSIGADSLVILADKLVERDTVIIPNDYDEQKAAKRQELIEQPLEVPEGKAENVIPTAANTPDVLVDKIIKADSSILHDEQTATKVHESIEKSFEVPEGKAENVVTSTAAEALDVLFDKVLDTNSIDSSIIPNDNDDVDENATTFHFEPDKPLSLSMELEQHRKCLDSKLLESTEQHLSGCHELSHEDGYITKITGGQVSAEISQVVSPKIDIGHESMNMMDFKEEPIDHRLEVLPSADYQISQLNRISDCSMFIQTIKEAWNLNQLDSFHDIESEIAIDSETTTELL